MENFIFMILFIPQCEQNELLQILNRDQIWPKLPKDAENNEFLHTIGNIN